MVEDYEEKLSGNLAAGLTSMFNPSVLDKREQTTEILRRKMDEIDRETWKLRFGGTEVQVKDLAQPIAGIISRVNEYISGAVASNPYAATAWTGVTLLLPVCWSPYHSAKAFLVARRADKCSSSHSSFSTLRSKPPLWQLVLSIYRV